MVLRVLSGPLTLQGNLAAELRPTFDDTHRHLHLKHRQAVGRVRRAHACHWLAQSRCRCGSGEPSPGADVAAASPIPVQMWQQPIRSRCCLSWRCTLCVVRLVCVCLTDSGGTCVRACVRACVRVEFGGGGGGGHAAADGRARVRFSMLCVERVAPGCAGWWVGMGALC